MKLFTAYVTTFKGYCLPRIRLLLANLRLPIQLQAMVFSAKIVLCAISMLIKDTFSVMEDKRSLCVYGSIIFITNVKNYYFLQGDYESVPHRTASGKLQPKVKELETKPDSSDDCVEDMAGEPKKCMVLMLCPESAARIYK